ncbi:hypothetical protein [Phenylobacterium sp.]|uniref:hypothetical protein n=1 Tax=Phenylobacterium sp. TaxID=1871053 RepID=UPI002DEA8A90|nr:hypothetical protein [Phenylobacterium sp.]
MKRSLPDLVELVSNQSRTVAYELVDPFAHLMTVMRETCGGDLERALVMVVIILQSSRHPDFRKLETVAPEGHGALPGFGTNVRSIADSTGIPKETVRRKTRQLLEAGWVAREGNTLRYSLEGYRAVAPARDALIRMYAQGYQVFQRLAAED